jgi:serine/threonine protein kinase
MSAEDKVLDNMVRFYGSWRQGDTYNILLEYVDGGTLEDFFKKTDPPTNLQEMVTLWKKFCDLTSLIALIHQHPHPSDKHRILQGYVTHGFPSTNDHQLTACSIHNDIKGKNILVTKRNGPSRFDVTFKLADFGLADFEYSGRDPHKHARRDMHGTQMFSEWTWLLVSTRLLLTVRCTGVLQ